MSYKDGLSRNRRRATILINLPGEHEMWVQELEGRIDEHLRAAITAARRVFLEEYRKTPEADAQMAEALAKVDSNSSRGQGSGPLPGRDVTVVQEPGKTKFVQPVNDPELHELSDVWKKER